MWLVLSLGDGECSQSLGVITGNVSSRAPPRFLSIHYSFCDLTSTCEDGRPTRQVRKVRPRGAKGAWGWPSGGPRPGPPGSPGAHGVLAGITGGVGCIPQSRSVQCHFSAIDEPVDSNVVMIESTAPGTQSVNRPLLTPRMELSTPAVAQGLWAAGSGCPSRCTCTQPSGSSLGPRL